MSFSNNHSNITPPTLVQSSSSLSLSSPPTPSHFSNSYTASTSSNSISNESLAQNLPYHILLDCFTYAADQNELEQARGGRLVGWDSNESVRFLSLICKNWVDAAQCVLYKSIAIIGAESARRFLRTCSERPDLAERVKALVIGLGDVQESTQLEMGQARDSLPLVKVIEACPTLAHLQVRPLHESARTSLMAAITSKPLLSLVCAPRLVKPNVGWTRELYKSTDIELALPTLLRLELDFWASPVTLPIPLPVIPPLSLVELRLHCDLPHELLFLLLTAAGSTLEVADLYFEKLLSLEETTAALATSVHTMKKLRYISNPTLDELNNFNVNVTPIFDRLLPHYQQLERLSVSATEVSTNLFRLLPPCLRDLEVQSFNHHGTFVYSNVLLLALRDQSFNFTLETFTVHDAAEVWEEESVELVRAACRSRGITFFFKPDSEGAESD